MSCIPSLSWQTSGTPDYISRQELTQFFSTLSNDLSGVDLSGLIFNVPNPKFSTIQMNPTGSITGASLVSATNALGISSVLATYNRPYTTATNPNFSLGFRDNIGGTDYSALVFGSVMSKAQIFTDDVAQYMVPNANGFFGQTSNTIPVTTLNTAVNQVALTNVSSINGNPPTGGTTFTTLTGTTLNATNVNTTNLNNVTQFNGLPKLSPYLGSYNITGVAGLNDNVATIIGTISVPITIPANAVCACSVPLRIGGFAPGSPAAVYFTFGLRVGGSGAGGGIFYTTPCALPSGLTSGFATICISGLFRTPTASATNTIEIIGYVQQGVNITCGLTNPVSPANVYSISVLS